MESSDYCIQENRNSGSIGVYFRFCRDERLRLWADLDRLYHSGSEFDDWCVRRDFNDECVRRDSNDECVRRGLDDCCVRRDFDNWRVRRDFGGNLVLGHQL